MHTTWSRRLATVVLAVVSASAPLAVRADPELSEALKSKRQAAVKKLGQSALEYAKFCAAAGACSEARQWFGAAITIAGDEDKVRAEFAKIAGKPDKADKTFQKDSPARLAKVKDAGRDLLQFIKQARSQDCDGLVRDEIAVWCIFVGDDVALKTEEYEWYAPLRTIAPSADVARFRKGELRLDGKWLSPDDIAKAEREHATFDNAWLLKGGWFEVHADVPLARAISTLNHAGLWRAHLWGQVGAEIDLRHPEGLLPIFVCATRKSLDGESNRFRKKLGAAPSQNHFDAFYTNVLTLKLNPLFISLEEIDTKGEVCPGSEPSYFEKLGHEVTHQLLTEGMKHKEAKAAGNRPTWVVEAFGTWAETWVLENGRFVRHFVKSMPSGRAGTTLPSMLELARRMKGELLPFSKFSRETDAEFKDHEVRSYAQTSLYGLTLLQDGDNECRRCFMRVAEATHSCLCDPAFMNDAFKGVDSAALDKKALDFLDSVKLEDR